MENLVELVQEAGRGGVKQWRAWTEGSSYVVEWGLLNGKKQTTRTQCDPVNVGKKNQLDADEVAQNTVGRLAKLKMREGYRHRIETPESAGDIAIAPDGSIPFATTEETMDSIRENIVARNTEATLAETILAGTANLCFYKPQREMGAALTKRAEGGNAVYVRKRDGEMFVWVIGPNGAIEAYSRRMHPTHDDEPEVSWASRFPQVVAHLRALNLPTGTVLLTEMVSDFVRDDFRHVTTITRSKTALALQKQHETQRPLFAYVWDVAAVYGVTAVSTLTSGDRLMWLRDTIKPVGQFCALLPPDVRWFASPGEAAALAKAERYEGWVVVDPDGVFGDKAVTHTGKPDRPATVAKLKVHREGDFLALFDPEKGYGKWGKGKKAGGVGAAALFAIKENGEFVHVGDCGSGLSDADVSRLATPNYFGKPMVWAVTYDSVTPAGKLRMPRFDRMRADKTAQEVDAPPQPDIDEE